MNAVTIIILGSGTCVPSLTRSSPSVCMEIGGTPILFDLGAGTMKRLMETGRAVADISHVFFSHFHPDHTGEFVSFLFSTKYPGTYRSQTPFVVAGAKGLKRFFKGLAGVYGHWIAMEPGMMNIMEFDITGAAIRDFDSFRIRTLPLQHIESSIGYRIETKDGVSIVYSGDTDFCDNLITLAMDADLLICESAVPDDQKIAGHLTPSLAGRIATRARVKHLVLTHFYPECDDVDIEAECRNTYAGPLSLARDLMKFEVTSDGVRVGTVHD
jgi:ribonuclease BN (tRNA processing enzyme)